MVYKNVSNTVVARMPVHKII